MDKNIVQYVQHQIAQAPMRLQGGVTDFQNQPYPRRHIYKKLERHVNAFFNGQLGERWVIMPGLRGLGKTTALSQLFLNMVPRFEPIHMLYVSLDEVVGLLNSSLMEVLNAYEMILGENFEGLTHSICIFVDESQYDPKWGLTLKSLFDKSKKVFICCTGSSAIALQTNSDVYRRAIMEKLYPLSFPEFQMLKKGVYPVKGIKTSLKQAIYFSNNADDAFSKLQVLENDIRQYFTYIDKLQIQNYLMRGTFPFAFQFTRENQLFESINGLLDKIIQQDIESLKSFDLKTRHSIKQLLFLLADTEGVLSISKLQGIVGIDSAITIGQVLSVLEQAELLIRILPYGSQMSKLNKPSKYLFMSPAIRMSLLGLVGKEATYHTRLGHLMEDIAAMHFHREFVSSGMASLSYDSAAGGADFILQMANQRDVVVEIGMGKKGMKQVMTTMKKIKSDYGIVVSDGLLKKSDDGRVICIPLQFFLMM